MGIEGCDMRFFFVDPSQIAGSRAVIEGAEASHIKNVVRLTKGETVGLVDGSGFEHLARIDRLLSGRVELSITARTPSEGISPVRIHAAQGYLKDKKMDRVVRQLSELGVARFIPLISDRAVVRPESVRTSIRQARWRKISIEALKQSRRGDLMRIEAVTAFASLLDASRTFDRCIIFWEGATHGLPSPETPVAVLQAPTVLVVLGPEGGFSEQEAATAEAAGFLVAKLGPRILRAETAAVAACAIVQYLFGDLGPRQKSLDKKYPSE
jgi:16S rRNA (uracil1498-N3)-methyltransferase